MSYSTKEDLFEANVSLLLAKLRANKKFRLILKKDTSIKALIELIENYYEAK